MSEKRRFYPKANSIIYNFCCFKRQQLECLAFVREGQLSNKLINSADLYTKFFSVHSHTESFNTQEDRKMEAGVFTKGIKIHYQQYDPKRTFAFKLEVPQLKVGLDIVFNFTHASLNLDEDSIVKVKALKKFRFMKVLESTRGISSVVEIGSTCALHLTQNSKFEVLEITFLDEFKNEIEDVIHVPENSINGDFARLFQEGSYSDVTLQCEKGGEFKVHRGILSIRSEFFAKLFKANLIENETQSVMCGYEYEIMSLILKYLYTGNVDIDDIDVAMELFKAADYYQLSRLKCLCKSTILTKTTSDNAISTLVFADSYGPEMEDLKKHVLTIIDWNSEEVVDANELSTISETIPNHVTNLVFKALINSDVDSL